MDKRTLLAVVLSVVVISAGFMIQGIISPRTEPEVVQPIEQSIADTSDPVVESREDTDAQMPEVTSGVGREVVPYGEGDLRERAITIETDLLAVSFTNKGGNVSSIKLKEHLDQDEPVEMIFSGDTGLNAFSVAFGGVDAQPIDTLFEVRRRGEYGLEFRRDFLAPASGDDGAFPFTLVKNFTLDPSGYLFELEITIENSVKEFPNLDKNGFAYSLAFGPQIGPTFKSLGGRGEFRSYYTYEEGKRKNNKMPRIGELALNTRFVWGGIVGKYFTVLGVPDATPYTLTFKQPYIEGLPVSSYLYFSRPLIKSSKNTDVFRFYVGPKTKKALGIYNSAEKNLFGLSDLNLDASVDTSRLLGWLESILKFFLDLFYRLVPNYGAAIILLTLFVKILYYPLTKKSYASTSKMQELSPKIAEIKERFKDNSAKMNQEMAALYKREKVNPLGGCLPLLLQMPIFIAMYGVMSKHFALRGAPFMLWIRDLSEPDSILNFGSFTLPLLNWNDLRILPILFVVTQLLSSKLMQTPNTSSSKNMMLMQYLMPVFFFFILYNAPAGLLLYWTMTNVITAAQQKIISAYKKSHGSDSPDNKNDKNPKGPKKK